MNLPIEKGHVGQAYCYSAWYDIHGAAHVSETTVSPVRERAGDQVCQPRLRSCLRAGSNCIPAAEEPRNEKAKSCIKLLYWGEYWEVFHMVAC